MKKINFAKILKLYIWYQLQTNNKEEEEGEDEKCSLS